MQPYLVAHDLGTSGNKASLFTAGGTLVRSVTVPYAPVSLQGIGLNKIRTIGGALCVKPTIGCWREKTKAGWRAYRSAGK